MEPRLLTPQLEYARENLFGIAHRSAAGGLGRLLGSRSGRAFHLRSLALVESEETASRTSGTHERVLDIELGCMEGEGTLLQA